MNSGGRKLILKYCSSQQDEITRHCAAIGPIQPETHDFPSKLIGGRLRRFNSSWFGKYKNWLGYSIKKDAIFCLCCYLFANMKDNQCGDFIITGFSTWNKAIDSFISHVGDFNSTHNNALKHTNVLRNRMKLLRLLLIDIQLELGRKKVSLDTSISCSRYLLCQGLPSHGHDEYESLENRGNFLKLVKFAASLNKLIADVVLDNAPKNNQLVAPSI